MMKASEVQELSPLPKPYRTGVMAGIPIVKMLLNPSVKSFIDSMNGFKNSYVGISPDGAYLYIDNKPALKVHQSALEDIKTILADDVREYQDMVEYRLLPERYKQILDYYI